MLDYLRSLYRHQVWADEELLRAVSDCVAAQQDAELLKCLHHMAVAHRIYLGRFQNQPFDAAAAEAPGSWRELLEEIRQVHAEEMAFLEVVSESQLENTFELPRLGASFTLLEGMTQAALHSQNHRGQCLKRLRELGSKPPTLDYILWAKDHRPRPGA